jgi:hypothetical protein
MAAGKTYEPIATTTLGSATSSVTFSSISGNYTDLVLIVEGAMASGSTSNFVMQFNSDTGSNTNYSSTRMLGDGVAASTARNTNFSYAMIGDIDTNRFTSINHIMNYANTSTYKTVLSRTGAAGSYLGAYVSLWRSTAAITSVVLKKDGGGNFVSGSTFTLYGIKAA